MKQRKAFLLRMDPALYEALEGWAQQELRSLNAQIEFVLKQAVAQRRKQRAKEETPPPAEEGNSSPEPD
jgi:hypothetical protein